MEERQQGSISIAKNTVKQAFVSSLSVMAGYLVLGMGFGILLQDKGYTWPWAVLMSVIIYAGAMQYVAVDFPQTDTKTELEDKQYTVEELTTAGVDVKGEKPEATGTVTIDEGEVTDAVLVFGDYQVTYDADAATNEDITKVEAAA